MQNWQDARNLNRFLIKLFKRIEAQFPSQYRWNSHYYLTNRGLRHAISSSLNWCITVLVFLKYCIDRVRVQLCIFSDFKCHFSKCSDSKADGTDVICKFCSLSQLFKRRKNISKGWQNRPFRISANEINWLSEHSKITIEVTMMCDWIHQILITCLLNCLQREHSCVAFSSTVDYYDLWTLEYYV